MGILWHVGAVRFGLSWLDLPHKFCFIANLFYYNQLLLVGTILFSKNKLNRFFNHLYFSGFCQHTGQPLNNFVLNKNL